MSSISTVFQSYQVDGWVFMKGCVQLNLIYGWKDLAVRAELEPEIARSVG